MQLVLLSAGHRHRGRPGRRSRLRLQRAARTSSGRSRRGSPSPSSASPSRCTGARRGARCPWILLVLYIAYAAQVLGDLVARRSALGFRRSTGRDPGHRPRRPAALGARRRWSASLRRSGCWCPEHWALSVWPTCSEATPRHRHPSSRRWRRWSRSRSGSSPARACRTGCGGPRSDASGPAHPRYPHRWRPRKAPDPRSRWRSVLRSFRGARSMSTPSTLVADRYRLVKMLGAGGMGIVWHAWDERLQRPVALKMLRTQPELTERERELATDRAMREARITAGLHHPHAVTVFDVIEHEGQPCIVMQLIESTPLSDLLREHGTLTLIRSGADRRPGQLCARGGAQDADRAPGREAGEHPHHRGRLGHDQRLRDLACARRCDDHRDGDDPRHPRLSRARGCAGAAHELRIGRVLARVDAVRGAGGSTRRSGRTATRSPFCTRSPGADTRPPSTPARWRRCCGRCSPPSRSSRPAMASVAQSLSGMNETATANRLDGTLRRPFVACGCDANSERRRDRAHGGRRDRAHGGRRDRARGRCRDGAPGRCGDRAHGRTS